jgi:glycosyltransferase involved in cell wall biosynthesis
VIWDLYPDVLVNFGALKEKSFIRKRWNKKNSTCFDNASTLFTLGKDLSDAIKKYTSKEPVIIHNWTNTEFVKPVSRAENRFAIQHGLTDKFVVMYSGNWGLTHNLESIVYIAEALRDNDHICFVLIGDGEKRNKIEQLVKEKNLKNTLLLPYQDKKTLPYSLACADIGIITLSKGAENVSVPSKTYSTLAAGSVILALASEDSELGLLVRKYKCGAIISGEKPREAAEFIDKLSKNMGLADEYKSNARMASKDFTPENAKLYYREIHKN